MRLDEIHVVYLEWIGEELADLGWCALEQAADDKLVLVDVAESGRAAETFISIVVVITFSFNRHCLGWAARNYGSGLFWHSEPFIGHQHIPRSLNLPLTKLDQITPVGWAKHFIVAAQIADMPPYQ